MYLKSIVVNGFKSFAERVNIDLSNKVNVVVGPNGSGKSNVVDAISWVLGTQSPGALRTNKMEDVIFAGTEKLSEKGFAEVYLNFVVDADKFNGSEEISIGRKLYRDGASEYFMNGLNCRLLDIQEFLSDLGIGKQQHTIISQGPASGRAGQIADSGNNFWRFAADDDQMIISGPAMIPFQMIPRKDALDNIFHVYFTDDTIKKIATKFLEENKQHNTDVNHDNIVVEENTLIESWIVEDPKMDKATAMGFDVPKGTWMVSYKINNQETWQKIKNGELNGFSITGNFIEKAQ